MLCAVALAFVFDGVCAQQASQTIMTAHGCPEAFPGELTHSTYHWCNKTTPLRRKCGADGILSHGLCEELWCTLVRSLQTPPHHRAPPVVLSLIHI